MTDQLRESISALMDGEADELELKRILSLHHSAQDKDGISNTWSRYHLARDTMHNTVPESEFRHLDISQQVSMLISKEPLCVSEEKVSAQWWRPAAGFAVAASVAAAVVFTVQSVEYTNPGFNNGPLAAGQASVASRVYPVQGSSMQASTGGSSTTVGYQAIDQFPGNIAGSKAAADFEAQKRLEKYMLRHTENAALNNGQGMMSFARVVSFEEQ
jgi:sigma-E factor negative regulatory protein RseA